MPLHDFAEVLQQRIVDPVLFAQILDQLPRLWIFKCGKGFHGVCAFSLGCDLPQEVLRLIFLPLLPNQPHFMIGNQG